MLLLWGLTLDLRVLLIRSIAGDSSRVNSPTVTGNGPVDYIAHNGIVVYGADTVAQVGGNKVSGNVYTGSADTYATGILVIDATRQHRQEEHAVRQRGRHRQRDGIIGGKFSA